MPQLNPIASCSHGADGKRTKSFNEPRWLYLLRRRMFGNAGTAKDKAHGGGYQWNFGPDGFRTCSACGSLHFDDFEEICRRSLKNPEYRVEPSDKRYKIYVRQPGVRNASEGAIKFYTDHLPAKVSDEQERLYQKAVQFSTAAFERDMTEMRNRFGGAK